VLNLIATVVVLGAILAPLVALACRPSSTAKPQIVPWTGAETAVYAPAQLDCALYEVLLHQQNIDQHRITVIVEQRPDRPT
jgi:hypothetical protein